MIAFNGLPKDTLMFDVLEIDADLSYWLVL